MRFFLFKGIFATLFVVFLQASSLPDFSLQYKSQASQDRFVYTILYGFLKQEGPGTYLEIGAGHPVHLSNTCFLETCLGWKGISIDNDTRYQLLWDDIRHNPLVIADATTLDYASILQNSPKHIDYLSLDIDEAYDVVLRQLPLNEYRFKVITIEHDAYRYGDLYRLAERHILTSLGYELLFPDVCSNGLQMEDWWIDPSCFPTSVLSQLKKHNCFQKEHNVVTMLLSAILESNKKN